MKTLGNVIQTHLNKFRQSIFTTLPAKVLEYDAETQTATVQPVLGLLYASGELLEMPPVEGCPVIFPAAGGASMTFPVKADDLVLLMFSMLPMDTWVAGNGTEVSPVPLGRTHDITDAICIVGLGTRVNNTQPDPDNFQIKYGDVAVTIQPDGLVDVATQNKVTVNSPLTEFNGQVIINSTLEVYDNVTVTGGDVVADDVSLKNHKHSAGTYFDSLGEPVTGESGNPT